MKVYKFIDGFFNILLTLIYLLFIFTVSCMFEFMPWYDGDGVYMLNLAVVWLPLCVLTILQIVSSLVARRFNKLLASLSSLNAVYIPIIFLLGFADVSLAGIKIIGVIAVITMLTYSVLAFRRLKKL